MIFASLVSWLVSGLSTSVLSVASHSSSLDELQRVNPRAKGELWTAAHYGSMRSPPREEASRELSCSAASSFSEGNDALYRPHKSVYQAQDSHSNSFAEVI